MTITTLALGGVVFAYTVAYALKRISPVVRFIRCKKSGQLKIIEGHICEKVGEEKKTVNGTVVNLCFPKFEYIVGSEKKHYQSVMRYQDACIGQLVQMGCCERTDEVWVIKDIPLILRVVVIKVITILILLAALILTDLML